MLPQKNLVILAAIFIWGFLPLYIKQMEGLSAFVVIAHRAFWALPLMLLFMAVLGRLPLLPAPLKNYRALPLIIFSALNLAANWLAFVYAVAEGQILEASAGYYMYPIFSSFIGMLVFKERLSRLQWLALITIIISVSVYVLRLDVFPVISLIIAISFSFYAIAHRMIRLHFDVLFVFEILFLIILSGPFYFFFSATFIGDLIPGSARELFLLIGLALLSCIALYAFDTGLKRIKIATVGIIFYLTPTLQTLLGALIYAEPLPPGKLVFFGFILFGVVLYLFVPAKKWLKAYQSSH